MTKRMKEWLARENLIHERKFCFTEGVSTVDDLLDMRREVEECREKYVVGSF